MTLRRAALLSLTWVLGCGGTVGSQPLDSSGYTALMEAAEHASAAELERLIRGGIDVDYQGRQTHRYQLRRPWRQPEMRDVPTRGMTPLMVAARAGRRGAVHTLLRAGADVNLVSHDATPYVALTFAVEQGHTEIALDLMHAGTERGAIGTRAALRLAIREGYTEIADALLNLGVLEAGARHDAGFGPGLLLEAARTGRTVLVDTLIRHGVNAADRAGRRALLAAARGGHAGAIRGLLYAGADPNAVESRHDWTPLTLAARRGHLGAVYALLEGGARPDARAPAPARATALALAAARGHRSVVSTLRAAGATVPARADVAATRGSL